MCGRYTYKLSWQQIVELYRLTQPDKEPEGLVASFNVAPTHVMPIIRPAGNGRELVRAGWGLVPYWLKPDQLGSRGRRTLPVARPRRSARARRVSPTEETKEHDQKALIGSEAFSVACPVLCLEEPNSRQ
jgi:putative SOS response-associated peptidase YedK